MKESRTLPQGVKPLECGTLTPGSGVSWVDLAWETGRTRGRGEECSMASGWTEGKEVLGSVASHIGPADSQVETLVLFNTLTLGKTVIGRWLVKWVATP